MSECVHLLPRISCPFCPLERRISQLKSALRREVDVLSKRTRKQLHWDGCEKQHPACAAIERMRRALGTTKGGE